MYIVHTQTPNNHQQVYVEHDMALEILKAETHSFRAQPALLCIAIFHVQRQIQSKYNNNNNNKPEGEKKAFIARSALCTHSFIWTVKHSPCWMQFLQFIIRRFHLKSVLES